MAPADTAALAPAPAPLLKPGQHPHRVSLPLRQMHTALLVVHQSFPATTEHAASVFDMIRSPLSFQHLLHLLDKYEVVSDGDLLSALVLVARLQAAGVVVTRRNFVAMFVGCLTVAHKFAHDNPYNNRTMGYFSRIPTDQLARVELGVLVQLKFAVAFTSDDIANAETLLRDVLGRVTPVTAPAAYGLAA